MPRTTQHPKEASFNMRIRLLVTGAEAPAEIPPCVGWLHVCQLCGAAEPAAGTP